MGRWAHRRSADPRYVRSSASPCPLRPSPGRARDAPVDVLAALSRGADLDGAGQLHEARGGDLLGWFFLRFFEEATWVALVAVMQSPVRHHLGRQGPTRTMIEEKPEVFDHL